MQGFAHGAVKVSPVDDTSTSNKTINNTNTGDTEKRPTPMKHQKRNSISSLLLPGLNRERGVSVSSLNPSKFDSLLASDFASGYEESATCLGEVTGKAAAILEAQSCHVWMIDQTNHKLYTLVTDSTSTSSSNDTVRLTKPLDRGITASIVSEPAGYNTTNVGTSGRWSHDVDEMMSTSSGKPTTKTKSYLAWPLWDSIGGVVIGVVEFRNKSGGDAPFNAADSQLARIVANQLANAIVHYRQQELIAGRNEAINKAYEETSYDATETICIEDNSDATVDGYSESGNLSSLVSTSSSRPLSSPSHNSRNAFAVAPATSASGFSHSSPTTSSNEGRGQSLLGERGWDYDTFSHTEEELIAHAIDIFDERGLLARYSIPVSVLTNFLREIIKGYNIEAPYHNHYHCFDVLHVCYLLVTRCKADEYLENLNVLSIFVAALAHDLGHDGYNNAFHAATESELAVTYNGVSILENNSAAQLFRILKKDDCNILARLSSEESTKMRSRLIDLILDTDAKNHFMLCTRFKHGMEMKQLSRGLLSSMLLHIADVSNPTRPGPIARKWAFVVQEEFFRQGDKEKELNLPRSPFMDRDYENLPRMQGAFIDAIVTPVFKLVSDFLPHVKDQCIKSLQLNRAFWNSLQNKEVLSSSDIAAFLEKDSTFAASVEDNSASSDEDDSSRHNDADSDADGSEGDDHSEQPIDIGSPIPGIPLNALHASPNGAVRRVSLISLHSARNLDGVDPELGEGFFSSRGKRADSKKRRRQSFSERRVLCYHSLKTRLTALLQSNAFQICMMLATLYALFASDLTMALGNKSTDAAIDVVSSFILLAFIFEMIASVLCIERYMRFFFWLDLAATISLIMEIDFLLELGSSGSKGGSADQLSLAKASRAAKVGARAARLSRLLRLVRLIRVAKVVKWMMNFLRRKSTRSKGDEDEAEENIEVKMSVVGQRMTESITKKVILAVLLTLLVFSLMDVSLTPDARQIQIDGLASAVKANDKSATMILRDSFLNSHDNIVMLLGAAVATGAGSTSDADFIQQDRIDELRSVEILSIQASTGTNSSIVAAFDVSKETEIAAWYSFGTTLIVTGLLAALSLMMNRDAYRIMIRPIEHMKDTVTQLSQNPLLHLEKLRKESAKSATSETDMLQVAITKMGTLLQIGFGTAGAEIIAKSLSEGGELDPMIPGSRINAIFGFCDIRDFTFATEGLGPDVMLFVNKIAAITHRHVVESGGAPNKNIGDAFLLVWKLATSSRSGGRSRLQKDLFDSALLSVQKIIADINKLGNLATILEDETDENAPWKSTLEDFKVAMGFGLHTGWAIEGSIGSKVKIDASYLSPHVNLASRLEAATKKYRVPLLMSEAFVSNLTGAHQKCCRKVDRVTFKGSSEPMTIYHFDDRPYDTLATTTKPTNYEELIKATSWKDGNEIRHSGVDITEITRAFSSNQNLNVREVYEDLFGSYLDGKWSRCKILCRLWMERFPGDVLVHNIVEYLAQHSFECPDTWSNHHPLTEK